MKRLSKIRSAVSLSETMAGASIFLENLKDNPFALSIFLLIKYKEWDQLVAREVNPSWFLDTEAAEFFDSYSAVSLVKKLDKIPTTIDKRKTAFEKFLESERHCLSTNHRIRESRMALTRKSRAISRLLFSVSEELKRVLGPAPEVGKLQCRFGPGASSSCKGTKVTVADKLNSRPEITGLGLEHLAKVCYADPHFASAIYNVGGEIVGPFSSLDTPRVVNYNKLSFVPKNGKTDRAICVEPTLSTYIQSGIGHAIRSRLFNTGLDLQKQHDVNARYARLGSIDGSYATIDLSAASDSISSELVMQILPDDWFDLLNGVRSPFTLLPDGRLLENNKFSSMGNGYTFELESMIFLAIVRVVRDRFRTVTGKHIYGLDEFMTYGDDIIVPGPCAAKAILYLNLLGFKTNEEKTFTKGPFRESCGKDYFNGHLVRPYFIKKVPEDARGYISIANGIRCLALRHLGHSGQCDRRFRASWKYFSSRIPKDLRCPGPLSFGDQVLFVPRGESTASCTIHGQVEIRFIVSVPFRSDQCKYRSNVVLQVLRTANPSRTSLRRLTDRVKLKKTFHSLEIWDRTLGQWC